MQESENKKQRTYNINQKEKQQRTKTLKKKIDKNKKKFICLNNLLLGHSFSTVIIQNRFYQEPNHY